MNQLYLLITTLMLSLSSLQAQSIFHIENGANLFIQPQASMYLDGLHITPSNTLLLNNVSLERRTIIQQPVVNSHIQRVYLFSNTVPSFSGTIRINYADNELNQLPEAMLTLNINNGVAWQDFKTNVIRDEQNNFVETILNTPVNMQELTLAAAQAALPLQWGEVKGNCNGDAITIQWETLQEQKTKQFVVERSSDGNAWQAIQLKAAAGQSYSSIVYSVQDSSISNAALWYYRIKSVDFDGNFRYSGTIMVVPCTLSPALKCFPVPAGNYLRISFNSGVNQKGRIGLYNVQGQQVRVSAVNIQQGTNLYTLNLHHFPAGVYIIKLMLPNHQDIISRFIKQ